MRVLDKDAPALGTPSKEITVAELPENPATTPQPQAAPPAAPPYQPMVAPASAPANSGGSSTLKIVLIILGVIVVLVMLAAGVVGYGVWRAYRSIHVNSSTGAMTINTPNGTITTNPSETFTAAELGTDIYPGAQATRGSMRMTLPTGPMVAANFLTSDSKDQVVAFYKSKLGSQATSMDFGGNAIVTLKKSNQEQVTVTISQQANQFEGKTQIHIMHVVDNQSK